MLYRPNTTLQTLVRGLKTAGAIQSAAVERVMTTVDRALFCRPSCRAPYDDCPQLIGCDVTISAPHMHAMMLETLLPHLKPGGRVLDVGFGSGILLAYVAALQENEGTFCGIEFIPEIATFGAENLQKLPELKQLLDSGKMKLAQGDGHKGMPEHGPFDAIHVGAAATEIPAALVKQLAPGGTMIVPVGPEGHTQYLYEVHRDAKTDEVMARRTTPVSFVPLVKPHH